MRRPERPGCSPARSVLGTYLAVGAVNVTLAGMAAWIAADFHDLHPVSTSRLRSITREQNEQLGEDGGGDQADARGAETLNPSAAVSSPGPKVGWSVLPTGDGWQTGLSIRW